MKCSYSTAREAAANSRSHRECGGVHDCTDHLRKLINGDPELEEPGADLGDAPGGREIAEVGEV
jgi:hypothetical protein